MENKNKTMTAEEKLLNAIFGTEQQVKDMKAIDYLKRIEENTQTDDQIQSVAYMLYDWCKVFDHELYCSLLDTYYKEFEHIYVKADKEHNLSMKNFAHEVLIMVQNVHTLIK